MGETSLINIEDESGTLQGRASTLVMPPTQVINGRVRVGFTSLYTFYASASGAKLDADIDTGGGTDDTAAIQALLNYASLGRPVHIVIDGIARVGPLDIYSNTTLEFPAGGGLYLKNGSNRALLRNKHPTAGSIVDHDITLIGGIYNGNSVNQTGIGLFSTQESDGTLIGLIQMYGVRRLKVHNVRAYHSKTIACHISNAIGVDIIDIDIDNRVSGQYQQGGLQLDAPCSQVTINGLRGTTQDDLFALNTDDDAWVNGAFTGLGPYITHGPITDVVASNIVGIDAYSGVRFFNSANRLDRIRISNIAGTFHMHVFNNDPISIAPGNVGTFEVDGVNAAATTAPYPGSAFINIFGRIDNLILRNIEIRNVFDNRPIVHIHPTALLQRLELDTIGFTDTSSNAAGCTPIKFEGKVRRFHSRNLKWDRDYSLAQADDFIKFTAATGLADEMVLDGVRVNKCSTLVNHDAGALYNLQMRGIRQAEAGGGLTFRGIAGIIQDFTLSNWFGDNCIPYALAALGAITRRRGDAFSADTTLPTYSSGAAYGSWRIVSITFSKPMNGRNYAAGVVIKKNTVAQTIVSAKRREGRPLIVDFVLSADIAGGDTVTWEYTAASGTYADWNNNLLADVSAQTVTVSGTGYVFDQFTAANGTVLSGRTPSPTTTSANTWSVMRGASAQQTIQSNRTQLDGLSTAQALIVNSTVADVTVRAVGRALSPYNDNTSNGFGLLFRVVDANNYWLYWLSPSAISLFKVAAGAVSATSLPIPHLEDREYEMLAFCSGNNITCVVDGGEILSAVDGFNNTATRHGIQSSGCIAHFDDFTVGSP